MKALKHLHAAEDRIIDFDHRTQKLFGPYAKSRPMKALGFVSKLGDQPELRLISGGMLLAGILGGNDRLTRAGARMLIAHEAATLGKDAIKGQIDRTRPRSARNRHEKKPRKGKHLSKELTSFPSGHSAGGIAVARAFSREYPEYGAAALGAAAAIAVLQVPRCAHYPSDVVAGVAIGVVAEAMTSAAYEGAGLSDDQ